MATKAVVLAVKGNFYPPSEFSYDYGQRDIDLSRLRAEAREDVTNILFGELGVFVDRTREKAFAQRAEGNETYTQFLERRQNLLLRFAPPE